MYGKLINNKLEIAGDVIKGDGWSITNPNENQYLEKGYKIVNYSDKPSYDPDNYKLAEVYSQTTTTIEVTYTVVELSSTEKNVIKQIKISDLELQVDALNDKLIRDIRVILNPNASAEEKAQAQEYYNEKMEQIEELIEEINSLKN